MTRRARGALFLLAMLFLLPVSSLARDGVQTPSPDPFFDVERLPNGLRAKVSLATLTDSTTISAMIAAPPGRGVTAQLKAGSGIEAAVAEPINFRGITLYPLQVRPLAGQGWSGNDIAEVEARFTQDGLDNVGEPIRVSEQMARWIERSVLNSEELDLETVSPVGRILIIVQDDAQIVGALEPYIEWKRQQGYRITVSHPTDNTDPYAIKNEVTAEYFSDNPIPLEYVLMIGDHDSNSAVRMVGYRYDHNFNSNHTDNWYVTMDGRLPVPDVAIGRFSVRELNQLRIGVNKTLTYERDGALDDESWIRHAALTAGSNSGISVLQTNQSIRWMFDEQDFAVDTLWWTMPNGGMIPTFIHNQIEEGVGYVNYRGYYGMSGWDNNDLIGLNNVGKLPVVVTITCGTGLWGTEDEAISEGFFRAGSVNEPVGAVACIGTGTTDTHTRFNNVIDAGVFEALLSYNMRSLGWALVNGKMRLAEAYNGTSDSGWIIRFVNWNNLMGDPALRMWLNVPVEPTVTHTPSLRPGSNFVDVQVVLPNEWPDMIWATVANQDTVLDSRSFVNDGRVRLQLPNLDPDDTITLTVVGDDVLPYQAVLPIVAEANDVEVTGVTVDDGADGIPNAGETVTLDLELTNQGSATISAGQASVSSIDPRVESIGTTVFNFPAIGAGQTVTVQDAVTLTISGWAPDGCYPAVTATFPGDVESSIPFEVIAWELDAESTFAWTDSTSDRRIFPGESGEVAFPVKNFGRADATGLQASLYFDDDRFTVLNNPVTFSDVGADSSRNNLTAPFMVQLSDEARVGELVPVVVHFEDAAGAVDSVEATFIPADPRAAGATGPDLNYGYWAVDDQDVELIRPEFDWYDNVLPINNVGLEDNYSGGAYQYGEEDASMVMDLPFPFVYYGEVYDEVTINTNGWIALGNKSTIILFRNWPIPNPMGPPAMIAPFWDDLHTGTSGVYASYDALTDRFIVTWDCLAASDHTPEIFQVILYGPTMHPTQSGNGRILFQYQDVTPVTSNSTDNDYITVGIESPDQLSGIEYVYWDFYRAGSEAIEPERAILLTDDLTSSATYSEGNITPDEVDITLQGVDETEVPIYIENVGDENLIWVLSTGYGSAPGNVTRNNRLPVESDWNLIDAISPKDSWGYYWLSQDEQGAEYDWIDPPADALVMTEDDLRIGDLDDGYFRGVAMPFPFEFYDSYYDSVYVNPNGFLAFQGDLNLDYGTNQNRIIPSTWAPNRYNPAALVMAWWDDLNMDLGGEVSVWTGVEDSVLVTWDGVYADNGTGPYTFQALIFKHGWIKLQYQDMDEANLLSATIGIQNHNAEHGLEICMQEPFMEDQLSLLIAYDLTWLDTGTDFGVLAPGETDTAIVLAFSDDLRMGTFEGHAIVRMNDGDTPVAYVPLHVNVEGVGAVPEVAEIDDLHVPFGFPFEPFPLDDYVTDDVWGSDRIRWSVSGNVDLNINVFERTLYIEKPNIFWEGAEQVTLTATNPEENSDSETITISVGSVSVDEVDDGLPREFAVGPLYPNPFNPSVTMEVALPEPSGITVAVYDVLGRLVQTISMPSQAPGYHRVVWDAGSRPSGVYFLHVQAAGKQQVRKAVLMK